MSTPLSRFSTAGHVKAQWQDDIIFFALHPFYHNTNFENNLEARVTTNSTGHDQYVFDST